MMREMLMGTCFTFQEAEIRAIEADIEQLKKGKLTMQTEDESPQLQALRTENNKLSTRGCTYSE